jgi:hypothetical protein
MIEGFLIRTVGLYPDDVNYIETLVNFVEIGPGDYKQIETLKKRTLSQVKIIPFTKKNKKNIYCEDQSITKEQDNLMQC